MSVREIDVGSRHIRAVNEDVQAAARENLPVVVRNTLSRHNLGIGLPKGADITFEGSVGYYCAGLNTGASVTVLEDAGWGVGEGMDSGHVTVNGYAGMAAGAAMRGGFIHVRGDAGPRIGVAMKGGNIVVEGRIGSQAGFMAHPARLSRSAAPGLPARTPSGRVKSGWPARSKAWVSMPASSSRRPNRSRRSMPSSNRLASPTPHATGGASFPDSAFGTSKAGMQTHG